MPSLDAGHYFLTVLAPIRADSVGSGASSPRSHRHLLAQDLALLRTGYQTTSSDPEGRPAPFARNTLNHLARFAIIEGPPYNGRVSGDTLVATILSKDPLIPQPVDSFRTPYLLFAADIDARAPGDPVVAYAEALWSTMAVELMSVFSHCVGFERVTDGQSLAGYLRRCEVETTMPFNDYWAGTLQAPPMPKTQAIAFGLTTVVAMIVAWAMIGWWAAVLVLLVAVWIAYRFVLGRGARPYPTAPNSDLPSVLKALYLKQKFVDFAIAAQGDDEAALHRRFGEFLATHQPAGSTPTQAPGLPKAP